MPKFNKKMPKNVGAFFSPQSDEEYKSKHPIAYKVLVAIGIASFMLPVIIYMIFTSGIFPAPNSGWLVLGWVGAFIVGIGLFNIVAAWINQYLGHFVTIGCFLLGGILITISCLIVYNVSIYNLFDENVTSLYFINLLFLPAMLLFYILLRSSVKDWMRLKGVSKTAIRKSMKGKRNFWWYSELHQKYNLGVLYYLNMVFTVLYPLMAILMVVVGWIKPIIFLNSVLLTVICVISAVMMGFSLVQSNIDEYGVPIILFRQTKNKGIDSILFQLMGILFPLFIAYAEWKSVLTI